MDTENDFVKEKQHDDIRVEKSMTFFSDFFLTDESVRAIKGYFRYYLGNPGTINGSYNFLIHDEQSKGKKFVTAFKDAMHTVTQKDFTFYQVDEPYLLTHEDSVMRRISGKDCALFICDCKNESMTGEDRNRWLRIAERFAEQPQAVKILCAPEDILNLRFRPVEHIYYRVFRNHIAFRSMRESDVLRCLIQRMQEEGYTCTDPFCALIDKYIHAVYPTADLREYRFIDDLIERIVGAYYQRKDQLDRRLDESCIPYYKGRDAAAAEWKATLEISAADLSAADDSLKDQEQQQQTSDEQQTSQKCQEIQNRPQSDRIEKAPSAEVASEILTIPDIPEHGIGIDNEKPKKNILLLALSVFPRGNLSVCKLVSPGEDSIGEEYVYQLEPVPEMLMKNLKAKGQKLDEVIIVSTKKGLEPVEKKLKTDDQEIQLVSEGGNDKVSPYQFFKYRLSEYAKTLFKDPEGRYLPAFKLISVGERENDGEKESDYHAAISQIFQEIRSEENRRAQLYIDIHGGLRDQQYLLMAVGSLLQYEGTRNQLRPDNVYNVEFDGGVGTIRPAADTITIQNFVSGIHEITNYARTASLEEFQKTEGYSENPVAADYEKKLLATMKELAQSIQFMDLSSFEKQADILSKKLSEDSIEDYKKHASKSSYIYMFIDSIRNSYRELLIKDRSTPDEIRWCMEKGFYQQSLTLIESKMPAYYARNRLIEYSQGIYNSLWTSTYERDKSVRKNLIDDFGNHYSYEEVQKQNKLFEIFTNWAFTSKVHNAIIVGKDIPGNKDVNACLEYINNYMSNETAGAVMPYGSDHPVKWGIRVSRFFSQPDIVDTGSKDSNHQDSTDVDSLPAFYLRDNDLYKMILYHSCFKLLRNFANHGDTQLELKDFDISKFIDMVKDYLNIVEKCSRKVKEGDDGARTMVRTFREFCIYYARNPLSKMVCRTEEGNNGNVKVVTGDGRSVYINGWTKLSNGRLIRNSKPDIGEAIQLNHVSVRTINDRLSIAAESWSPISKGTAPAPRGGHKAEPRRRY